MRNFRLAAGRGGEALSGPERVPQQHRRGRRPTALISSLLLLGGLLIAVAAPQAAAQTVTDPASLVNPFIGTGNGGAVVGTVDTFPGPAVPFGMIQWSPDTRPSPTPGGYYYGDSQISGFSLTHLSGVGCYTGGDVPFLPSVGAIPASPGSATASFSHSNESASAGYYQATLNPGTTAAVDSELTVTQRSGIGRFTYPATTQANMLIKTGASLSGNSASTVNIDPQAAEVTGSTTSGHFCGAPNQYTLYFAAQFNHPFSSWGTWTSAGNQPGATSASDPHGGAWVTFDTSTNTAPVLAKVGISYVSTQDAMLNLQTEDPGWNFDTVHNSAVSAWNAALGKIKIAGGTSAEEAEFYTALYHVLLHPNVFDDVNGNYIGFDNKVHTLPAGHHQYANYSGWDIYRSTVPLQALLFPQQVSDMAQSLVNDAQQGGWLPKWGLNNGYTGVMNGDAADPIIAEAYAFGAQNFDVQGALQAMLKGATDTSGTPGQGWYVERPQLGQYQQLGYVPNTTASSISPVDNGASETQEYALADFSIANLAKSLGDTSDYQTFMSRAQNWENLFNPGTGYIQPKGADGAWPSGPAVQIQPNQFGQSGFQEGNAAQYTWMIQQNIRGLMNAMGGNAAAIKRLDTFFTSLNVGPNQPYMWAGNEPSLDTPWEYDYVGAPYKAQQVVREIVTQLYSDSPGGAPGNDDLGAMSSWFAWAAMGLYPESPGVPSLVIGSPLFSKVTVSLANGKTLTINAPGASDSNEYVQSLSVNGQPYQFASLPASAINSNTTLDFTLGTSPNTSWGAAVQDQPHSFATGESPAIGYTNPTGQVQFSPGTTGQLTLGLAGVAGTPVTASWTASAPSGLTLSPAAGSLTVDPAGRATTNLALSASQEGIYTVTFHFTTSSGQALEPVVMHVVVAKPGSLIPYFNNTGISDDTNQSAANFDGVGYSYSQQALDAAGLTPGAAVHADGLSFTWPNVPAGQPDNVVASGQTITIPNAPSGNTLAFLGSATNGPAGGLGSVTYTDGTTQQLVMGMSDWTLNAGSSPPTYGNSAVASMPYRNCTCGTSQGIGTKVLLYTMPLDPSKQVASFTLPPSSTVNGNGKVHVFAYSIGNATVPAMTLQQAFNNSGVSNDNNQAAADFDYDGYSYSAQGLAGGSGPSLTPGSTFTSGGTTFTWPSAQPGFPDNVAAQGQAISLSVPSGATSLGFVGSGTNGNATGPATITYSDGSTQTFTMGLTDWARGGSNQPLLPGNQTVKEMSYRNCGCGAQNLSMYVFSGSVPLEAGKTPVKLTLPMIPNAPGGPMLHLFAVSAS